MAALFASRSTSSNDSGALPFDALEGGPGEKPHDAHAVDPLASSLPQRGQNIGLLRTENVPELLTLPGIRRARAGEETVPGMRLVDLDGADRDRAIATIREGFVGIYRWHAKRTLRSVEKVRAALVDGEVIGISMLERLLPEVGYVYYLAVVSARRRQGVGGLLLDDALARFRSQGVEVVYGAVEEDNEASRALFRSRGFRPVERKELGFRDGGLGAWGLRSRMWVVTGEVLFGLRLAPAHRSRAAGARSDPNRTPSRDRGGSAEHREAGPGGGRWDPAAAGAKSRGGTAAARVVRRRS